MRFIHTADLHIGKVVNDFSMLAEQRHALRQIIEIAVRKRAEVIVIAGDVYDRSIPPAEAVGVLDEFLTSCSKQSIVVLMIAGNHDSPERLSFAESILARQNIHVAGNYAEPLRVVTLFDQDGAVDFVLMPFVKPAIAGAQSSMEAAERMTAGYWAQRRKAESELRKHTKRSVLVTHFFVTDGGYTPELSDAETTVHVGGLDNVEAGVFEGFDYTALGHIHKPQQIGSRAAYYAGAPLKYSFSECAQTKSVNLVELDGAGRVQVDRIPITPLHEMRIIQGRLKELIAPEVVMLADKEDYIQARITDEEELIDPIGTLRSVYPHVMQLILMKQISNQQGEYETRLSGKKKSTMELFEEFYYVVKEEELDAGRREIVAEVCKEAEQ